MLCILLQLNVWRLFWVIHNSKTLLWGGIYFPAVQMDDCSEGQKKKELEEDSLNGFCLLLYLPLKNIFFPDSIPSHSCLGVHTFLKALALELTYDE